MAQRNSPSRRIPGEPLAGILRTVAYQARYSNRRRANVVTVTNSAAAAESAEAAAGATVSAATLVAPATMASASQPMTESATLVAAGAGDVAQPLQNAATLMTDGDGRATWPYEDRGQVPHVVATVVADQPAVATVSDRTATAATVHAWDLTGQPVAGAFVSVVACWP